MAQGKCAFCGTFVTGGGTSLGKHSVACTACTPLAMKWLEMNGLAPVAAGDAPADDAAGDEKQADGAA
jgi:dethiobiotin synthetase